MTVEPPVGNGPPTLADPLDEALRVVDAAEAQGLLVRLIGGLAIRAHAPAWTARTTRDGVDLDFAINSRQRPDVFRFLEAEGYHADRQHNALFGGHQGYFVDLARKRPVDVLVDRLDMCHRLDFADRLAASRPALPPADLLLSKLQVMRINRKDVLDALVLLGLHPLAQDDGAAAEGAGRGSVNLARIVDITSNDWGWWRTVTGNIDRLTHFLETEIADGDLDVGIPLRFDLPTQLRDLRRAIDDAPKSTRWRLRARVGDRVQWYAEPEEVAHDSL